jgi:hypothetical protein
MLCVFFSLSFFAGVEPSPLVLMPFIGPFYQPWIIDGDNCGAMAE